MPFEGGVCQLYHRYGLGGDLDILVELLWTGGKFGENIPR